MSIHQININVSNILILYGILDVFPGRGIKIYRQIEIEISIFQHVRALCKRNNEIFLCMQIKSCPANFRVKQFKCILPYDIISFVPVPVFSLTNFLFLCKGDIAFYSLVSKAVYLSRTILVIQALSNWDQNNFYFEKQDTSITVNSKSNLLPFSKTLSPLIRVINIQ